MPGRYSQRDASQMLPSVSATMPSGPLQGLSLPGVVDQHAAVAGLAAAGSTGHRPAAGDAPCRVFSPSCRFWNSNQPLSLPMMYSVFWSGEIRTPLHLPQSVSHAVHGAVGVETVDRETVLVRSARGPDSADR